MGEWVMLSEFEERMIDEITKIRETLATMAERDKQTRKELLEVKDRVAVVEKGYNECPARLRAAGWGAAIADVMKLAAITGAVWAALEAVFKFKR